MKMVDVLDLLLDVSDFLDDYTDVDDGEDGRPVPNRAMRLRDGVDRIIKTLEREVSA